MRESYDVKLEGKEWTKCLEGAYKKRKKDVKIDGFRKGSVPYDVYVKKAGIESLYMDAADEAVNILFKKLMEDKKTITPAATPAIDVKNISKDKIEITITLVGAPEIKLGKYKKLGIKKEEVKVTKDEIDHEIEHLKSHYTEIKVADDGAKLKNGMIAVIDFEGFLDGTPFKGGKGEDYNLELGSNTFIPGFEEALVGLKKGDKKDVNVSFPDNYHVDELKGKPVVFKVEVKDVKERIFPELNDDFFEDLNMEGVKNEKDLRKHFEEELTHEKTHQLEDEHMFKCLDKIVANSKFEIPVEMTNDETEAIVKEFGEKLTYQGLRLEEYLKYMNTNIDDFKKTLEPEANKRIGYRLVMDAIIKEEKLEVSDEEYKAGLEEEASHYGMSVKDFEKEIGTKEMFKYNLLVKKAMKVISE